MKEGRELTTQSHLATHAQPRFHHFADALVSQEGSQLSRQTIPENIQYLEENDFVGNAVARFKLAVSARG